MITCEMEGGLPVTKVATFAQIKAGMDELLEVTCVKNLSEMANCLKIQTKK